MTDRGTFGWRRKLADALESWTTRAVEEKRRIHAPGGSSGGIFTFPTSTQTFPPPTLDNIRRHGYEGNEIAYMGIAEIATTFASIPIVVRDRVTLEIVKDHPVSELLNRGAPSLAGASGFDIRELWATWLYVSGNGMLEKICDDQGRVVELWPVRMDRISGVPGAKQLFTKYVYQVNGKKFDIPIELMLHARMPSLSDDYWGMSPLRAAFGRIVGDNEASRLIHAWLKNKGTPGVAIMAKGSVTTEKADRARERYLEQVEGNEGGIVVLGEATDLKFLAFDFQQLAMPDLMAQAESRILGVLGVPPILVGAKVGLDKGSYANYSNARKSFYHETITTVIRRYLELFAGDPDFDPGTGNELSADLREFDALAEERNARHTQVREDHAAKILTRKEARVRQGYPAEVPPELEDDEAPEPPVVVQALPAPQELAAARRRRREKKNLDRAEQVATLDESIRNIATTSTGRMKTAFLEHYALVEDDVVALIDQQGAALVTAQLVADAEALHVELAAGPGVRNESGFIETKAHVEAAAELPDDFEARLVDLQAKWGDDAASRLGPLLTEVIEKSGTAIAGDLGFVFDLENSRAIQFVESYTVKFARRTSESTLEGVRSELLKAMDGQVTVDGLRKNFEESFPGWSNRKAELVARTETNRASNAGAKSAYIEGGATKLVWLTSSDPCEFCASLSGKIVGVEETFVPLGAEMTGVNGGKRVNRYLTVETPPLHPNCVCTIVTED